MYGVNRPLIAQANFISVNADAQCKWAFVLTVGFDPLNTSSLMKTLSLKASLSSSTSAEVNSTAFSTLFPQWLHFPLKAKKKKFS